MNQRDLELLSAYLDGQLNPSDVTRLEARFQSDPQLVSVLNDLRSTRNLLRKLPARRAPHNFTLTRKMVGQNPPLPRAYPIFRLATTLATLLFVFSFGLNSFSRFAASQAPAFGMGGGGGAEDSVAAPYAAEIPATEAPAATEAPSVALAPPASTLLPTQDAANAAQTAESPTLKTGEAPNELNQSQPLPEQQISANPSPLIPSVWQIGLAIVAVVGLLLMLVSRRLAMNRWR
jgi:anti-sigma factor RsiW